MGARLGLIAAVAFVVGPVLAWIGIVPSLVGFVLFALGGLIALVVGIVSLVQAVRGRGVRPGGVVAMVTAIAFIALAARGAGVPRINDYTTDPSDPPTFTHASGLPANVGRDMSYPAPFAAIQSSCCADLHPARLRVPPPEAFKRAHAVAAAMPSWTITTTDPAAGILEATATSRLFKFQDDIVIRVRPDGDGSRVDMRSKSRDGQGDFGVNAARIRTYVAGVERAG